MQPISMMRSPSLALRPVVSVSRTTWRVIFRNPLVGERVSSFVFRMPGVAAHPVPLYLMFFRQLAEALPQVHILHRLFIGGGPAAGLPFLESTGRAFFGGERGRLLTDPPSAASRPRRPRARPPV